MNREYSLSPWPRSHVCHIICWVRTNIPGCWRKTTSGKWRIQNTERETAERMRAGRICHKLYAILCDLLILNLAQCSAAPFRFPATFVSSEFFFHFTSLRCYSDGTRSLDDYYVEWMKRNLGEMLLGKTNVANNCKFPEKKYVVSIGMKMKFRMAIVVDSNGP